METPLRRRIRRLVATGVAVAAPVLTAGCNTVKQPGQHYPSLGAGMTILLFVIVPLGAFGTIALLAALPSLLRRPRYRPGKPWDHDPLWFAGPDNPEDAITRARPGRTPTGGASAEW